MFTSSRPDAMARVKYGVPGICAVGSFYDLYLVKQGKHKEILLQLPSAVKRRINVVLARRVGGAQRERQSGGADGGPGTVLSLVIAAFVSGLIVSLLELACTGQLYLPSVKMMLFDAAGKRLRALAYLLVYNVAFVVPLLGVFVLAYAGVTSEQLRQWLMKRLALTKLAMGLFFLLLGATVLVVELL